MKNKIAIFTCLTITIPFVTYKPLCLVLIFTLFSCEYFLFMSFVGSFLKARKSEHYVCFSTAPLRETTFDSTYEIWFKINEIYAYRKLYSIVSSKKFNFRSILFTAIIIFLEFPIKVYKIMKFLIRNDCSLHVNLTYFYDLNYKTVENKKIEIIYKKIYLNSSTKVDIIKKMMK